MRLGKGLHHDSITAYREVSSTMGDALWLRFALTKVAGSLGICLHREVQGHVAWALGRTERTAATALAQGTMHYVGGAELPLRNLA